MKRIKLFEAFINEHKPTEGMSEDEIRAIKDEKIKKGDVTNYLGKPDKITSFMKNLTILAAFWVDRISPTYVRVVNTPDEDSQNEIADLAAEFDLVKIDLNSKTEENGNSVNESMKDITIDDLKKGFYESIKERDYKDFYKFSDGWMSTSKKYPLKGGIFMDVDDLCVVQFKDKYGRKLTGIITDFSYDTHDDTINVTVKAAEKHDMYSDEWSPWMNAYNYGVSIRNLKVIEGKIPPIPNKPTFK